MDTLPGALLSIISPQGMLPFLMASVNLRYLTLRL